VRAALNRIVERYRRVSPALRWLLAVAWAAGIWWASSQTGIVPTHSTGWSIASHSGHFVIFGLLGTLLCLALDGSMRWRAAIAMALALLYAIVDEVHQGSVPGRDSSAWDVCADVAGAGWFCASLAWLHSGDRRSRAVMLSLVPVGAAAICLATFV
jgi:VanZ family protein